MSLEFGNQKRIFGRAVTNGVSTPSYHQTSKNEDDEKVMDRNARYADGYYGHGSGRRERHH